MNDIQGPFNDVEAFLDAATIETMAAGADLDAR